MKKNWKETTLGEVCEILDRLRKPISKKDRIQGPIPYYGATRVVDYIDDFIFDEPLVLVGEDGAKWNGGDATAFAIDGKTWVNNHAHVLRPNRDVLIDKWLIFWLTFSDLSEFVTGVTVPKLNQKNLRSIKLPLPPLQEQRRIVALLDEAFIALTRARENVENNLAEVDRVVRSTLDDLIAKNSSSMPFQKLKDITLRLTNGYVGPTRDIYHDKGVPYLLARHVKNNRLKFDERTYVTPEFNEKHKKSKLKTDDVVLVQSGHIGHCAVIDENHDGHNCHAMIVLTTDKSVLSGEYLATIFATGEFKRKFQEIRTGSTVPHLTCKLVKELEIPLMSKKRQSVITQKFSALQTDSAVISQNYITQLRNIDDLRQSLLQRAFAGELTESTPLIAINDNERDEHLSTATLVLAFNKHLVEQRHNTFGHVKAQKTLHLTESIGGLDLGRQPQVRQAGPHDQEHFVRVEAWAKKNNVFEFKQRRSGGYTFTRGTNYDAFLSEAKTLLADYQAGLSRFLPLMVEMNTEEAEIFTTVHAAWNNLLVDGKTPSDEGIVTAARENWHESKMDINRQHFFDAITKIRRHDLEPDGSAKYVSGAQESLI